MKTILIIIFILIHFGGFSQKTETVLLKTNLIPQYNGVSCWASSIGMIKNYYENCIDCTCDVLKTSIIKADGPITGITCTDTTVISYKDSSSEFYEATDKYIDEIVNDYFINYNFKISVNTNNVSDYGFKFPAQEEDSLPWKNFKHNFLKKNPGPILNYKRYFFDPIDSTSKSHVYIYSGFEQIKNNNEQLKLIFVKDPWPYNRYNFKGGSEYLISYEYYKKQIGNEEPGDPINCLLYDFNYTKKRKLNKVIFSKINKDKIPKGNYMNLTTKNSDENLSLNFQAAKTLDHLKLNASDTLLKLSCIESRSVIDTLNKLKVITISNLELSKFNRLSDNETLKIDNAYKGLVSLFEGSYSYIIPVITNGNVTSTLDFELTKNNEWYTTRISKYTNSIFEIINEVTHGNIKDIKEVYFNQSFNFSPEYLIIVPKDSSKNHILIDIFSKIDFINKPENKGIIGPFNYQAHSLDEKKRAKFITYLSPNSVAGDSLKITYSGKKLIETCQKLIDLQPVDTGRSVGPGRYFLMPNIKASEFDKLQVNGVDSLTYIAGKDIFPSEPQKEISIQFIDKTLLEFAKNNNIPLNFIPDSIYNLVDQARGQNFTLFFVPINKYKRVSQIATGNNFSPTKNNLKKTLNYAIYINDIKAISNPRVEATNQYMNSHPNERNFYRFNYSSKGILCDVLLKNSNIPITCYLLSSNENIDSKWIKWKE